MSQGEVCFSLQSICICVNSVIGFFLMAHNSLLSESVRFLYQNWRDRRTYSSISPFKEWWGRVDYLVTNIIFVVKDFLFGKDGRIEVNSSPQSRRGREERPKAI